MKKFVCLVFAMLFCTHFFCIAASATDMPVPDIRAYFGEEVISAVTTAEYAEDGETVSAYKVSALSDDGYCDNTAIEISELLQSAEPLFIALETDFAEFVLNDFGAMATAAEEHGRLFFKAESIMPASEGAVKALSTARQEIRFGFFNEDGEPVSVNAKISVSVPYTAVTAEQRVRAYGFSDGAMSAKDAVYSENLVKFNSDSGETVVISEGTALQIRGRSLDLKGTISLIFYGEIEGFDAESAEMLFWDEPQTDYAEETAERIVKWDGKDANGYRFEYENISSRDMGKTVYARLKARDMYGNIYLSDPPSEGYSVVKYAENMLGKEKLHTLLVKMLNYGAAAQEYFGSEYPLVNSILTDGEKAVDYTQVYKSLAQTIAKGGAANAAIRGKTLVLDGDISINYYTEVYESADEMGILFWTENAFRATDNHVFGTHSSMTNNFFGSGSYKVFTYGNIVSSAMNKQIYARVYTRIGNEYKYGDIDSYSVRDYAAGKLSNGADEKLTRLLRTMMLYGTAAEEYFSANIEIE